MLLQWVTGIDDFEDKFLKRIPEDLELEYLRAIFSSGVLIRLNTFLRINIHVELPERCGSYLCWEKFTVYFLKAT